MYKFLIMNIFYYVVYQLCLITLFLYMNSFLLFIKNFFIIKFIYEENIIINKKTTILHFPLKNISI
jgi:hypothetical protein